MSLNIKKKSQFGHVILTAKELKYVEYMMLNYTYKEIACMQGCSITAVRKKYANIKKKLGNTTMSSSALMIELKNLGVLDSLN